MPDPELHDVLPPEAAPDATATPELDPEAAPLETETPPLETPPEAGEGETPEEDAAETPGEEAEEGETPEAAAADPAEAEYNWLVEKFGKEKADRMIDAVAEEAAPPTAPETPAPSLNTAELSRIDRAEFIRQSHENTAGIQNVRAQHGHVIGRLNATVADIERMQEASETDQPGYARLVAEEAQLRQREAVLRNQFTRQSGAAHWMGEIHALGEASDLIKQFPIVYKQLVEGQHINRAQPIHQQESVLKAALQYHGMLAPDAQPPPDKTRLAKLKALRGNFSTRSAGNPARRGEVRRKAKPIDPNPQVAARMQQVFADIASVGKR